MNWPSISWTGYNSDAYNPGYVGTLPFSGWGIAGGDYVGYRYNDQSIMNWPSISWTGYNSDAYNPAYIGTLPSSGYRFDFSSYLFTGAGNDGNLYNDIWEFQNLNP